jgi:hypothetical protein
MERLWAFEGHSDLATAGAPDLLPNAKSPGSLSLKTNGLKSVPYVAVGIPGSSSGVWRIVSLQFI